MGAEDLERLTQAAEDLADIEAAHAARAEIAEHGTIPWDEVKADLGRGRGRCNVRLRASFAEILSESRLAVDRAERGRP